MNHVTPTADVYDNAQVTVREVPRHKWGKAFDRARRKSEQIRDMTTPEGEVPTAGCWYLTMDNRSGFGVLQDGEIVGLFSLERGRGPMLVESAKSVGGSHLDCFDGYLPKLYSSHGFVEDTRVPNWTPGGPDVVYMRLES